MRIINRLDVKEGSLIKGIQLEGWRKYGDPVEEAQRQYKSGIDEIFIVDVVASLYGSCLLYTSQSPRDQA